MSASLVGSEMCIRDRCPRQAHIAGELTPSGAAPGPAVEPPALPRRPVSYTHLTLPTICSV
eukprot:52894-Alexandrium_andersonii.AAC.1